MFYETERVIRKQAMYMGRKAGDVVRSFDNKEMTTDEVIACIDIMLSEDNNTETRVDVLNLARKIVISNKEKVDEQAINIESTTTDKLL